MKPLFVAIISLTSVVSANSADETFIAPPPINNYNSTFDWSGGYIGAHLGYGWQRGHFADSEYNGGFPSFPAYAFDVDVHGAVLGAQAGYNWQSADVVYGLEGELGYMRIEGSAFPPFLDPFDAPYDGAGTFGGGWYGSLAARLGYALDRSLVYGKIGGIYSGARVGFLDTCSTGTCGGGTFDASRDLGLGLVVGAGLEHAITDTITAKAEYNFNYFGSTTISGPGGGTSTGLDFNIGSKVSTHIVKIGLNYKF
ncbi:porin family protein [Devosia sp. WQ 349]|uniref:outer membrane protein n=1 Tax=Devosia sp. WQ 349K1 TaxID=2800329 RepID=UPI0019044001|nr:outer membrane beta-barrel protein [Devosia sp. WQ 349K1]MBK1793341.1 porin family protein [Devosia sp. WQ 349K1]